MTREPRILMGMSFWGFLASWAAVLTESNPMYAKNMSPAPRRMPDQPPNCPLFAGMKGCQLAVFT